MSLQGVVVLLLCSIALVCGAAQVNNRPIIGVYAQPSGDEDQQYGEQFIAASYVKFVEGAGGRVAPIRYTLNESEIETVFNSINGFLLPGGGVDFGTQHQYWTTLSTIYALALKANARGDYFPIWGTCMGFQELCLLQSQNMSLLSPYDSENYTVPIDLTPNASKSRLLGSAPSSVIETLANKPVTMNNHMYGVSPASWKNEASLSSFFNVLSTNVDRNGNEFISTMEGNEYPVYGTQWHPEKPIYEWNIHEVINHETDSVAANQYLKQYIYNLVNDFEQGYFFNATM